MAILILFCIVGFMSWWFSNHFSDYGKQRVQPPNYVHHVSDNDILAAMQAQGLITPIDPQDPEQSHVHLPITAEYPVVEDDPVEGTGAHTFTVDPIWANTVPESMKITDQYPWTQ